MKRIKAFLFIFIILAAIFTVCFGSDTVHAALPTSYPDKNPGEVWSLDKDNLTGYNLTFVYNDAYESGAVTYPFQYLKSVYNNELNQRVWVRLDIRGVTYSTWNGFATGVIHTDEPVYARIIQFKDWVDLDNDTWNSTAGEDYHNTSWFKAYWSDLPSVWRVEIGIPSTSDLFSVGKFAVEIKVYTDNPLNPFDSGGYKILYRIYGTWTAGSMKTEKFDKGNPADPYKTVSGKWYFGEGKWYASFYYVGTSPDDIKFDNNGIPTGTQVQLMKNFTADTTIAPKGYFHNEWAILNYTFSGTEPSGVYLFVFRNSWNNVLYRYYTFTVYNNVTSLTNNTPPQIKVTLSGATSVGDYLKITVYAWDDNATTIRVWITGWFGADMYLMPSPTLPIVRPFMYPLSVPNGGSANVSIFMAYGGEYNVYIIALDDKNAWNDLYNATYIKSELTGGGGSYPNYEDWFKSPFGDIISMAMLFFGIIMIIVSRSPLGKGIGILLVIASFINWDFVAKQIMQMLPHFPFGVMLL